MKLANVKQKECWKKKVWLASCKTELEISYEFNQSGKKQPGKNCAMNFSCRSHTVTLVAYVYPLSGRKIHKTI